MAIQPQIDLEDVISDCRREFSRFFSNRNPDDTDYKRVRVIQGIYASATRELQTRGAQEATRYAMAQDVLRTPEQRAEYLRLSSPDHKANAVAAAKELTYAQS